MGVPLLLTWLRKQFSSCFVPARVPHESTANIDNLFIDLNALLYQSVAVVAHSGVRFQASHEVEDAVLRKLFDILDDIVFEIVKPKALVYIAVDGISPLGKMSQQRARRWRDSSNRRPTRGNMDDFWENNNISVGTRFMSKTTAALHLYCVTRAERANAAAMREAEAPGAAPFRPLAFVTDDVYRPGEGENKIAEIIRCFRSQADYNPNTSHVICSSDTDVTVSCLLLHEPRIHVLRYEPPASIGGRPERVNQQPTTSSGGSAVVDSWSSTMFSIHVFREKLREVLQTGISEAAFENALHDVVCVMLLFGNDFIPALGGSIQEGTLDFLLELLASDFVSRGQTIVEPTENSINVASARYLVDCLQQNKHFTRGGDDGGGGPLRVVGADAADWGFVAEREEDDERKQARDKEMERKCYCYWTMLQWALHYSAGTVDHWGCYYPYSTAPPLHELRKYCGFLPYEALQVERGKRRDSSTPTDVLTQLIVLLPPRSITLLPPSVCAAYAEVADDVKAPVEALDLEKISQWCAEKRAKLSEDDRTRFAAYDVLSRSHETLAGPELPWATAARISFVATWPQLRCAREIAEKRRKRDAQQTAAAATAAVGPSGAAVPGAIPPPPPPAAARLLAGGGRSLFSSTRRLGGGGASAAAAAAAAAALAPSRPDSATHSSSPPFPPSSSSSSRAATSRSAYTAGNAGDGAGPREDGVEWLRDINGAYHFLTMPCRSLGKEKVALAMGAVEGGRFQIAHDLPFQANTVLSRRDASSAVRLEWCVAIAPEPETDEVRRRISAQLLPGYTRPSMLPESVVAGKRPRDEMESDDASPATSSEHVSSAKEALLQRLAELKKKSQLA